MIDYSKWPRKKFLVTTLKLDDQNPRLPGTELHSNTQPQIINYLIDHENAVTLAKSIGINGYLPNEEPIVCKEGNKYVVLEGNRRIAACKILINPDLIRSPSKRKVISNLASTLDINLISKVSVVIAPDRDAADIIIVNRHTEGTSIEKWDKTKQDRFFHNRVIGGESIDDLSSKFNLTKSAIKDALARYNMYQELLKIDLPEAEKKEVEDETKFSMTNVERFYKSKLGRKFLGVEFDKDSNIKYLLPRDEYVKRLKRITSDAIKGTLNSRTYGDDTLQSAYIKKLTADTSFDMNLVLEEHQYDDNQSTPKIPDVPKTETGIAKPSNGGKSVKAAASNKLMPSDLKWRFGNSRIDKIFTELKDADLKTQFNGSAILFRSFLDMIVYQYLAKDKGIKNIIIKEQKKLDEENGKRIAAVVRFVIKLGISEEKIRIDDIKKLLPLKKISREWTPTLKQMLTHIAQTPELLTDSKLRQALASYVKGTDGYLDHNDFNLLTHNEYFLKDGEDLKKAWDQLYPILNYIYKQISI